MHKPSPPSLYTSSAPPAPLPRPPVDVCRHGALLPRQHLGGRPGPGAQRARLAQVVLGLHAARQAHVRDLAGAVTRQQDCARAGVQGRVCVGGRVSCTGTGHRRHTQHTVQAYTQHRHLCRGPRWHITSRHPPPRALLTVAALDVQVHDAVRVLQGNKASVEHLRCANFGGRCRRFDPTDSAARRPLTHPPSNEGPWRCRWKPFYHERTCNQSQQCMHAVGASFGHRHPPRVVRGWPLPAPSPPLLAHTHQPNTRCPAWSRHRMARARSPASMNSWICVCGVWGVCGGGG